MSFNFASCCLNHCPCCFRIFCSCCKNTHLKTSPAPTNNYQVANGSSGTEITVKYTDNKLATLVKRCHDGFLAAQPILVAAQKLSTAVAAEHDAKLIAAFFVEWRELFNETTRNENQTNTISANFKQIYGRIIDELNRDKAKAFIRKLATPHTDAKCAEEWASCPEFNAVLNPGLTPRGARMFVPSAHTKSAHHLTIPTDGPPYSTPKSGSLSSTTPPNLTPAGSARSTTVVAPPAYMTRY